MTTRTRRLLVCSHGHRLDGGRAWHGVQPRTNDTGATRTRHQSTSAVQSSSAMTVRQASALVASGQVDAAEVLEYSLKRQGQTKSLNAYVTTTEDRARQTATEIASSVVAGVARGATHGHLMSSSPSMSLKGVPIAIKDNFCTAGVRTTASSRMLETFVPPYSATPVERLEAAGAIIVGKTNMDEFGMGSATIFSHFGETISPWSPPDGSVRLVAGGSSGGSAAAVASGSCLAALGSDTGGSVRQPAAWCGLVGLKPTYGRVSRHGLIAYASSLDCPGVLAKTVADAGAILDVIAGPDDKDSTCSRVPVTPGQFSAGLSDGPVSLKGVRIGIPTEFRVEEMDENVIGAWYEGMKMLEAAGADVVPVSIPSVPLALPAYFVIASAEASSNLARYDGIRYGHRAAAVPSNSTAQGLAEDASDLHAFITRNRTEAFGHEVQRRILTGCFVLSAKAYSEYYERALSVREAIRRDMASSLSEVHALLTPCTPTGPFPVTQPAEPASLMLNDIMTIPASLAGLPAVSVPVAVVPSQYKDLLGQAVPVPVGLQLIGRSGGEAALLQAAAALEAASDFALQIPPYVNGGA